MISLSVASFFFSSPKDSRNRFKAERTSSFFCLVYRDLLQLPLLISVPVDNSLTIFSNLFKQNCSNQRQKRGDLALDLASWPQAWNHPMDFVKFSYWYYWYWETCTLYYSIISIDVGKSKMWIRKTFYLTATHLFFIKRQKDFFKAHRKKFPILQAHLDIYRFVLWV